MQLVLYINKRTNCPVFSFPSGRKDLVSCVLIRHLSSRINFLFRQLMLLVMLFNNAFLLRWAVTKSVTYLEQQNALPAFKECWPEYKQLNSQTLQATLKRVDLSYNRFIKGLSKKPKFKSIRNYSGWTYPGHSGWEALTEGKHGQVRLRDLGITIRMRGSNEVPQILRLVNILALWSNLGKWSDKNQGQNKKSLGDLETPTSQKLG